MKGAVSFLILIFLSIGFSIINSFVNNILLFFLANLFSGGVSFIGFPVGIFPVIGVTIFINVLIFLPVFLIACVKIYKRIVDRFTLEKFNKFLVLTLSGLIISFPMVVYPIDFIKSEITQKINNSIFKVNAEIVEEKVEKVRRVYPVRVENTNEYHYKILLDNQSDITFKNMNFSVTMGFNNGYDLFEPDTSSHPTVTIYPGANYVSGKYKVEPSPRRNIRIPQKVFMSLTISDEKIYKDYELESKFPDWDDIFQNR